MEEFQLSFTYYAVSHRAVKLKDAVFQMLFLKTRMIVERAYNIVLTLFIHQRNCYNGKTRRRVLTGRDKLLRVECMHPLFNQAETFWPQSIVLHSHIPEGKRGFEGYQSHNDKYYKIKNIFIASIKESTILCSLFCNQSYN